MRKHKRLQARPIGFLSIKCEKCGNINGFFSRDAIQYNRCKLCDRKTPLIDLAPAELKCKCGQRSLVSTNMTESIVTINCPFCRAPVDLELDRAGTTYRTMETED
jgi:ribosomal protein S27E